MSRKTLHSEAEVALGEFDEVLKKRGKARKEGIESWFDTNQAHHFALIDVLARDKSASRRKLITPYFLKFSPGPREQDAYRETMEEFILGTKPTLSKLAIEVLGANPEQSAHLFDVLCTYGARAASGAQGLSVLECINGALEGPTPPSPEEVTSKLDPLLDHWSMEVSERAAELILLQGGQPRASRWKDCPLDTSVRRQLSRLGVRIEGSADPSAPRTIEPATWQVYGEAMTDVIEMSWPAAYFIKHVRLPHSMDFFGNSHDGDGVTQYKSPKFIVHREGGETYYFCAVLCREGIGVDHCINVTESSADPVLYEYDGTLCPRASMSRLFSELTV